MNRGALCVVLAIAASCPRPLPAAVKLLVTVAESKTGKAITNLKAADFAALDDGRPRQVEAVEYQTSLLDVMMLLDSSLVGEAVLPVAADLIRQLQPKEQMAIVAFHSSADLVQEFTSSQELLQRALHEVKFGNNPKVLDALYAAADEGFAGTTFRRVLLLVTTGLEGYSRVSERSVIALAQKNAISIFPVYAVGQERSLFESLARRTGGVSFSLRDLTRGRQGASPAATIFETMRGAYTMTLSGNLRPTEKLKIEVKLPGKVFVSALVLD